MSLASTNSKFNALRVKDQSVLWTDGAGDTIYGNFQSLNGIPTFYTPAGVALTLESSASPLTTKGDILTYSTTPTRLGIGATNTVLVADSTQTTGNKWSAILAGLTLTTPTIGDFTNATHTHQNAAGGGTLSAAAIASGTLALARGGTHADLSATGGANQFLKQSSSGADITVAGILSADLTTALTTPGAIGLSTSAAAAFTHADANGTAGNGYWGTITQSSAPSAPADGFRLYADASHRFSWIGQNGYVRTFDGTANTADHVYTLPDVTGNVLVDTGTIITVTGGTSFRPSANSTAAINFDDVAGQSALVIDTTNKHLAIGPGANSSSAQTITVSETFTQPAETKRLATFSGTMSLTANDGFALRAFNATASIAPNSFNATGTPVTAAAVLGNTTTGGTTGGTITRMAAGSFQNLNAGTSVVVTNANGVYIETATSAGAGSSITNLTGLTINAVTVGTHNTYILAGTATQSTAQDWFIYSTTTSDSYIAGKLRIGGSAAAPSTALHAITSDSGTNAVVNVSTITHNSSGSIAASFGVGSTWAGQDTTTADVSMGDLQFIWTTATHASRKARGTLTAYDTASRTCIQWEASGTAAMVGFLGTAPIVQTTAYTQTYATSSHTTANPTATSVVTTGSALASYGYTQAQADDIVTELNRLITDVANVKNNVNAIIDDIQA